MFELKMKNLELCFESAKKNNVKFVAVKIEIGVGNFTEITVNPIVNADEQLEHYKNTYDDNLRHRYKKGVKIVGFSFGDALDEIEEDLI